MAHTQKNIKTTFLLVLPTTLFALITNLERELFSREEKMQFIEVILKEYDYCKKMIKKYFNKNLIMSAEQEERFELSNKCWTCDKSFVVRDIDLQDTGVVTFILN